MCENKKGLVEISKSIQTNLTFSFFIFIIFFHRRMMYWTDWGYHAKIERAEMSGQQRVVLVNSSLSWPNGLTLDQERNRLYWVDASYSKLEYLHLSTNIRVTLIHSYATLPHPFGLTLLGDYLYWTDWRDYTVYRANKERAADVTVFVTGIGQPMDIHGYNLSEKTIPGERATFVIQRYSLVISFVIDVDVVATKDIITLNSTNVEFCGRAC